MKLVAFEGPLGSGKTTLTNLLSKRLAVPKALENYRGNPFLEDFYQALAEKKEKSVALQTELAFMLVHYHQLLQVKGLARVLTDFTFEKDLVFARMNLRGTELALFEHVHQELGKRLPKPSLVVMLEATESILRDRILQRGRPFELKTDFGYMVRYGKKLEQHFRGLPNLRVEVIDTSDLKFAVRDPKMAEVTSIVRKGLGA
jgi:deoxyguanosine kinase